MATPSPRNKSSLLRLVPHILLVLILVSAGGLRLWGINFGLPYLYHPDESNKIQIAQRILQTGDLNPHYYLKPPFFIYLNTLAYLPYLLVTHFTGTLHSVTQLKAPQMLAMAVGYSPQPNTILVGRLLTWTFGMGSVLLTYALAFRFSRKKSVALFAAAMMALSSGNVIHSHFITPDEYVVFFALLTAWFSLLIYQDGRTSDYILAGVAGALAAGVKYNAVLVLILPAAAHFLKYGWIQGLKNRKFYFCVLAAPLTFILTNPYVLLDFKNFYAGMTFEASHYSEGHLGMEGSTLPWYLNYFWSVEGIACVIGVIGMLAALIRKEKQSILLMSFPIVFFVFISSFQVRNDRTAIPILPFLFIFAASLLVELIQKSSAKTLPAAVARIALIGLAAVCLVFPAVQSYNNLQPLVTVNSRETARIWVEENLPQGSTILIESYSPYINPDHFQVQALDMLISHDAEWVRAHAIDYVVASEGMYQRFYQQPQLYSQEIKQYDQLFSSFELVKLFSDGNYEVRIYRVK